MLSVRSFVIAASLAGMLAGCFPPSAPESAIVVSIDGAVFQRTGAPGSATIPFTVANRSGSSQFVARCGTRIMAAVDRWNGQTWLQYSGDACTTQLPMAPLELNSGAVASATRAIAEPGRYQLRIGISDNPTAGYNWSVVSADFEIQ